MYSITEWEGCLVWACAIVLSKNGLNRQIGILSVVYISLFSLLLWNIPLLQLTKKPNATPFDEIGVTQVIYQDSLFRIVKFMIIRKYNGNEILHKRTYKVNEISRTFPNKRYCRKICLVS